jgi:ATP-dependent DNA helicase PIF1
MDVERQAYERTAALVQQEASQAAVLQAVQQAVDGDVGGVFFLSAYAGCGKTFLEQTLLHWVRSRGQIALAVASTGIAALLLEGGNTLHSKLKAPLSPYTSDGRLNIRHQSAEAQMIREAKLLIWDEAVMHPEKLAHNVDMSLRDIRGRPNVPFGGLVVLWGGDFRQTLPIQEHATAAQTVSMCLHQWPLWTEHTTVLTLSVNQRCKQLMAQCSTEAERTRIMRWASWLEQLGDGHLTDAEDTVALWPEQCREMRNTADFDAALQDMYGPVEALSNVSLDFWADRAIVAPKHSAVDYVNARMLDRLPGRAWSLLSIDTLDLDNSELDVGTDFLNRQASGNMAPHQLTLKVGCVVMLLRNLAKRDGLVNGTRMLVRQITRTRLKCVILTHGVHQGNEVVIPRIKMKPKSGMLPFMWSRIQFPVKLSYAMTYV